MGKLAPRRDQHRPDFALAQLRIFGPDRLHFRNPTLAGSSLSSRKVPPCSFGIKYPELIQLDRRITTPWGHFSIAAFHKICSSADNEYREVIAVVSSIGNVWFAMSQIFSRVTLFSAQFADVHFATPCSPWDIGSRYCFCFINRFF